MSHAGARRAAGFRQYELTDDAIDQARLLGVQDPESTLVEMARLSAPVTHPGGNRRFDGHVMRIEDGRVVSVALFDGKPVRRKERSTKPDAVAYSLQGSRKPARK